MVNMKYHIITYGCQMNESDSERIATVLEKDGYSPASKENEADLIVVNMCSVRQSAVDRVYGLIQKFKKMREKSASRRTNLKTILTGCILRADKPKLAKGFDQILKFKDLLKYQPKYQDELVAFVPISNGCNNICSYCAVPFTRGPLVCRNHKDILKEIRDVIHPHTKRALVPKAQKCKIGARYGVGAREIWLLGQNVNDYQSPADSSVDFAKLLKMIDKIPGNFKIFLMSPHPKNFSDELIDTLTECKKFAKYLNLPVQSGDDEILKKMNRPYTIKEYKNLVKKIRKRIPDINLSTDVIVGFPGETKKQFENTSKLFKEVKFNIAYLSKYSPRPGTVAFKMENNVLLKEKKRRWKILNDMILSFKKKKPIRLTKQGLVNHVN